jgi:hypothetical protein
MKRSSCLDQYPLVENSTAVLSANELLWGDWDKGQYGVVLRAQDGFDKSRTIGGKNKAVKLPPASFLHASTMTTTNPLYYTKKHWTIAVLVGSKLECTNNSQLSLAEYLRIDAKGKGGIYLQATTYFPCSYHTSRMVEMVAESNTLFRLRNLWSTRNHVVNYVGWTECPVSTTIEDSESLDALVIQLPPEKNPNPNRKQLSMCQRSGKKTCLWSMCNELTPRLGSCRSSYWRK